MISIAALFYFIFEWNLEWCDLRKVMDAPTEKHTKSVCSDRKICRRSREDINLQLSQLFHSHLTEEINSQRGESNEI